MTDYDFEGRAYLSYPDRLVILAFGKHVGTALPDVPTHYLKWMLDQDFPKDLGTAVAEELKARGEM